MLIENLNEVEKNILIGSILGDGCLRKISRKARQLRSSYIESFSEEQLAYREWKVHHLSKYIYFNESKTRILSKCSDLFTELEGLFYCEKRIKIIPAQLLHYCILPHFLTVLFLDDGSLSISYRVNDRLKKIYLTPHIYLYLQSFQEDELLLLKEHLQKTFNITLAISRRKDGSGFVLKTNTTADTLHFLDTIQSVTLEIPSMYYKSNWAYRFELETKKWKAKHPDYEVLASDRKRSKAYSEEEIQKLLSLKKKGFTDQQAADLLGRTYWSVVYKLRDLRLS